MDIDELIERIKRGETPVEEIQKLLEEIRKLADTGLSDQDRGLILEAGRQLIEHVAESLHLADSKARERQTLIDEAQDIQRRVDLAQAATNFALEEARALGDSGGPPLWEAVARLRQLTTDVAKLVEDHRVCIQKLEALDRPIDE